MAKDIQDTLALTLGMLTLRIWLGLRALQSGIEKFAGSGTTASAVNIDGAPNEYGLTQSSSVKEYAFSNYQGVPEAMAASFQGEPLIPDFALSLYNWILGPALLILGLTLLIGIATRYTLFAMGLLYTSLTFGLILLGQDAGIAWLGTHILLIVAALALAKHNRFEVLKKW